LTHVNWHCISFRSNYSLRVMQSSLLPTSVRFAVLHLV
jgi:hypothetical protein